MIKKFKELPFLAKVTSGSASSLAFGLLLGYVLFPVILKYQLKKEMSLRNKTDMKEMWVKLPFPMIHKVWVWNVTNPEEAQKGSKPIVKEVGPYVYEKWYEKTNIQENSTDDTIAFNMRTTYHFLAEESAPLTGDEMVFTPQLLLVGTATFVAREKEAFLKLVTKAINTIFKDPPHLFPLNKVSDMLFNGIIIDCTTKDFAPKAVCTAYKTTKSLEEFQPGYFKYSIFGHTNATDSKRYKVYRGIKNISDVGRMVEYNGQPTVDWWKGDHCNELKGTDATIFRPFLSEKDILYTFNPDICRSVGIVFEKKTKYRGIKGLRFTADYGDVFNEPENHCLCRIPEKPETCPPKGFLDISGCIDAPIYISLPHFYKADPVAQSKIIGQNPVKEKHEVLVDLEPISGTPLYVEKRTQVNCPIINIPQLDLFKTVPDSIIPIVWVEETLQLNKTYINMLNFQLFYPKKAVGFLKWSTIFGGVGGLIYALSLHRKEEMQKVRAVTPSENNENPRLNINSAESQNHSGITPLDKDGPAAPTHLPGVVERY